MFTSTMQFLGQKTANGRPLSIGKWDMDKDTRHWGVFVGYLNGNKIYLQQEDYETLMRTRYPNFRVEVTIKPKNCLLERHYDYIKKFIKNIIKRP